MSDKPVIDPEIRDTIKAAGREAWRERFASYEKEVSTKKRWGRRRWLSIAAGLVLLASLGWLLFDQVLVTQPSYADYFEPYPAPASFRGPTQQKDWAAATKAYQQKDYAKAAATYQQLVNSGQYQPAYLPHFYAALSLMSLDESSDKIQFHLEAVLAKDSDYRLPAKWYLALHHWKMSRLEKAESLLKEIAEEGDFKAEEAATILADF